MPIQGPQQPGFWLPGAEYFSLSPNTNIALQGRRRIGFDSGFVNIPATTDSINAVATAILENPFLQTSAIYVHHYFASISATISGLVVNNVFGGLSLDPGGFPEFPLGNPTLTSPTVNIGTSLLNDRDRLITWKDIQVVPPGTQGGTVLRLQTQLNVNNPEVVAGTFKVYGAIIYTRLDGILE